MSHAFRVGLHVLDKVLPASERYNDVCVLVHLDVATIVPEMERNIPPGAQIGKGAREHINLFC